MSVKQFLCGCSIAAIIFLLISFMLTQPGVVVIFGWHLKEIYHLSFGFNANKVLFLKAKYNTGS